MGSSPSVFTIPLLSPLSIFGSLITPPTTPQGARSASTATFTGRRGAAVGLNNGVLSWKEKLRALEWVEREAEVHLRQQRLLLTPEDRQTILAVAEDLPALWHAPDTTPVERKQLRRLIVKEVILDQTRARGKVWFQINWQTGAITEHWLVRHVRAHPEHAELEALQERVRQLNDEQKLDEEIAEVLNREGFHTARGQPFSGKISWILRKLWGIATVNPESNPDRWPDGAYAIHSAAVAIGVYPGTIYQWLYRGLLHGEQIAKGLPLLHRGADPLSPGARCTHKTITKENIVTSSVIP